MPTTGVAVQSFPKENTMTAPTQSEYRAAKKRYATWTKKQHQHPTPEMLRDVKTINDYERAQDQGED